MRDRMARHSHTNLYLLQRLLVPHDDARHNLGFRAQEAVFHRLHLREIFACHVKEFLMPQVPRRRDNQVARGKTLLMKLDYGRTFESPHSLLGPQYRFAQRVIFPEVLSENLVHEIVGVVLIHFYFFENDASLAGDVLNIKYWVKHKIAEHIHRNRQVIIENFDVETDALLGRECIHVAADGIDLPRNALRGAMLRSLKDHVLDEMGNPIPLQIFVPRSGLDPNSHRDRANVLHLLGNKHEAVRQHFPMYIAGLFHHGSTKTLSKDRSLYCYIRCRSPLIAGIAQLNQQLSGTIRLEISQVGLLTLRAGKFL